MNKIKKTLFIFTFLISFLPLSANKIISSYTQKSINDFYDLRLKLFTLSENQEALPFIDEFEKNALLNLKENAIDYKQEDLIIRGMCAAERYNYIFSPEKDNKELTKYMKQMMEEIEDYINHLPKKQEANYFTYSTYADLMSFYMFSSIPAVLKYGFKVRDYYIKAYKSNPKAAYAISGHAIWMFFAPGIFGGSVKKSRKIFEQAYTVANTDFERFWTTVYYSQSLFEEKKYSKCAEILDEAEKLNPNSKLVQTTRYVNKKGFSLLQYNRDRTKLDDEKEKMGASDDDLLNLVEN